MANLLNIFDNHGYENVFFDDIVAIIAKHWEDSEDMPEMTEERFLEYFETRFREEVRYAVNDFCMEYWPDDEFDEE